MLDLGGITVRAVVDEDPLVLPRTFLFRGCERETFAAAAMLDPLACDLAADQVLLRVQVHVIEIGGRIVVVDAGIGDGKERPQRPSWHRRKTDFLARLGVDPADVSLVVLTHLHADHVGWLTRHDDGRTRPTFPNARHVVSQIEFADWATRDKRDAVNHGSFRDSVLPVLDAGLLDKVPADATLLPGLDLEPLPGHTLGQVGVRLSGSRGAATLTADAVHHPAQLLDPAIVTCFCAAPDIAIVTRRNLLARAAEARFALVPAHARGRMAWQVVKSGGAYTLAPP